MITVRRAFEFSQTLRNRLFTDRGPLTKIIAPFVRGAWRGCEQWNTWIHYIFQIILLLFKVSTKANKDICHVTHHPNRHGYVVQTYDSGQSSSLSSTLRLSPSWPTTISRGFYFGLEEQPMTELL